jgi:endonuclease III
MSAKIAARPSLPRIIDDLESAYGTPPPPPTVDPWEMILRENVVYLAGDGPRDAAFRALKKDVGTKPREILDAPKKDLVRISRLAGILAENSARKVRKAAEIAESELGGDVRRALDLPVDKARRALKKFPGIGDPGADKILLFACKQAALALDSNGLRALVRLGFAKEGGPYASTYREAQRHAQESSPRDFAWLIKAHQLLRIHGQRTCKNTRPLCETCVLKKRCPFPDK